MKYDPYGEEVSKEVEEDKQDIYEQKNKVNKGIEDCIRQGPSCLNFYTFASLLQKAVKTSVKFDRTLEFTKFWKPS